MQPSCHILILTSLQYSSHHLLANSGTINSFLPDWPRWSRCSPNPFWLWLQVRETTARSPRSHSGLKPLRERFQCRSPISCQRASFFLIWPVWFQEGLLHGNSPVFRNRGSQNSPSSCSVFGSHFAYQLHLMQSITTVFSPFYLVPMASSLGYLLLCHLSLLLL